MLDAVLKTSIEERTKAIFLQEYVLAKLNPSFYFTAPDGEGFYGQTLRILAKFYTNMFY